MKNHNCGAEAGAEAPVNENDKNTSTPTWLELQPISTMAEKPDLEASSLDILDQLSPAWRLFLLGDGSPTRHLRLLTGSPTAVDVIEFVSIGMDVSNCPAEVALVPGPRSRRQVWLKTESGERLGYAVSWWNSSKVESFFNDKALPIGMNVVQYKQELYRDILKVFQGQSRELQVAFHGMDQDPPADESFWGRYYIFYHRGEPLTLIYEVFSPRLCAYLGPYSSHTT